MTNCFKVKSDVPEKETYTIESITRFTIGKDFILTLVSSKVDCEKYHIIINDARAYCGKDSLGQDLYEDDNVVFETNNCTEKAGILYYNSYCNWWAVKHCEALLFKHITKITLTQPKTDKNESITTSSGTYYVGQKTDRIVCCDIENGCEE